MTWSDPRIVSERYVARLCACRKHGDRQGSSGFTNQLRQSTFDEFQTVGRPLCVQEAYDVAVEYSEDFASVRASANNNLLIVGASGSGKTHLLEAATNFLTHNGVNVMYWPWVEGSITLRHCDYDDLHKHVRRLQTAEVLCIDDLYKGRSVPTDFQLEHLFAVIEYRYVHRLPLMISSERDVEELLAIDEGIARRIIERSRGHRVKMSLRDAETDMELNFSLIDEQ